MAWLIVEGSDGGGVTVAVAVSAAGLVWCRRCCWARVWKRV